MGVILWYNFKQSPYGHNICQFILEISNMWLKNVYVASATGYINGYSYIRYTLICILNDYSHQ